MPRALFTSANAKEMAAKSAEVRRKAEQERLAFIAEHGRTADAEPANYISERLARARKQVDMLSDMLECEEDPQKLDRLASALARLSEIERQLANRPLPGSLKPSQPRQQQRSATVEPIGPAPVQSVPEPKPSTAQGHAGPGQAG